MDKIVDLNKTVYELCTEDTFIIEIMKELGFEQITKQGMLQTAGRVIELARKTTRACPVDVSASLKGSLQTALFG